MTPLFICFAGGVGALTRFVVDGLIRSQLGRRFPWGTLLINVSGALLLGVITALYLRHGLPQKARLIVGTGFCGGYTTFSTASFEAVRLLEEKRLWAAFWQVATNIVLTVGAVVVALRLL